MADDIASIGVKFETDDIARGKASLEALAQQGPKVEKAMAGVEGAAVKTGKSIKSLAEGSGKGLDEIGKAAPKAAEGVGRVAKSADDAKRALAAINSSVSGFSSISASSAKTAADMLNFGTGVKSAQQMLKEMQAQAAATNQAVAQMGSAFASAIPQLQAAAKAQLDAAKNAADMGRSLKEAEDRVRSYASAAATTGAAAKSFETTAAAVRTLNAALAVAGIGFGAQELIGLIDGYAKFTAQLKLATKSATDYALSLESVKRIATDAQQGLGEVGTLYARIANGTAELGLNQSKLADITETVALSLKVSNAAASESASAMLQLSQAFASGVLRGEEFNAVNEAAPRLMKALADGIGVPIGALRKMASEGQLTSSILAEALPKALGSLREEAKTVQTISGSFTVLKNNIMEMVGAQSSASGVTKALATSVNVLASNLDVLATTAGAVALVMGSRVAVSAATATAAFMAEQVAVVRLGAAISGASVASVAGLTAMSVASRAAAASLAFLTGPWGAAILLAGGAAAAFYSFRDSSEDLVKSIGGLNQPLDELKKRLNDLPAEKQIAIKIAIQEEQQKSVKQAKNELEDLIQSVAGMASIRMPADQFDTLIKDLREAGQEGGNLAPVLEAAAKAGNISPTILQRWLEMAARLRDAQAAASGAAAALGAASSGTSVPLVSAENSVLFQSARAALEASKSFKSQAEQMAEVRKQGKDLTEQLNKLKDAGLGNSKEATQLTERLKGVDERLESMAKRGQKSTAGVKAEQSEYARLMASITGKIELNKEELKYGHQLNDAEKLRVMLTAQLDSGAKKLTAAHAAKAKAALQEFDKTEKAIKAAQDLKKAIEGDMSAFEKLGQQRESAIKSAQDSVQKMRDEAHAYDMAAASGISLAQATEYLAVSRLENHLAMAREGAESEEAIERLERELKARRELLGLIQTKDIRDANKKAADDVASYYDRIASQAGQSLSDALIGAGRASGNAIEQYFSSLILRPTIEGSLGAIGGQFGGMLSGALGLSKQSATIQQAASSASPLFNLGGLSSSIAGGVQAGLSGWAGTLGLSATGTTLGGSLSAGFTALGAGNIAGGLGTLAGVATPVLGAIAAISALSDLFGAAGTQEYGGTAVYSAALGAQTSTTHGAFGTGFGGVAANDQILANVAGISKSIVDALDATAKTFGQTVGYEAAAGFASDFGDEATWGGLRIALQGKDIVNWDDTRTSKWAPKEFASGDEGYKQYLNAVALDVKTALLGMDLPTWASQLVSAATDLDTINAALQQIGTVKAVFDGLGQSMSMFSGISGELQTQLLSMSGSIDALSSNAGAFYEGFFSESERMDILARNLRESLSELNLSIDPALGDDAKESFRAAVEGAMDAGQGELAAKLLAMSGSFATAADYAQKQAEESSQAIISAAQEAAQAAEELAASLRSSLIGLEARFAEGGFSRQYQAQDAAVVLQGLFAGVGIQKDSAVLTQQILAATAPEIEAYFRDMWGMLDSDAARQQLVEVTGSLLDLAEASKQAAEAADNAAKQQREQLEQQYLQLIGNTAELRRRELEALDPSNRALQELIWSIQDGQAAFADMGKAVDSAASAAQQAWSNWGTANNLGLKYLGDTSGLEAQKAILQAQIGTSSDPADRLSKLQELIGIEEALGNAEMANRKAEQAALNARQSALQKELSAAQALLSAAQSLGEYAKSLQTSTASGLSDTDRLAALGDQYTMLMSKARGGDKDALSQLQGVSSDYLSLAQTLAVSGADYSVLSGRIASELDKLATGQESTANWQISSAQSQLDQLTAQSEALNAQVEISDATKGLIAKSMIDQAEIWDRENTQYLSMISLQEQMTGKLGTLPTDIYKALKPAMDSSASYIASTVSGSVSGAINSLAGLLGLGGTPGFASGGYHVGGLRIVGENGPELEATGPSRIWNQSQLASALGGGQGSAALISEVRALREQNARLEARLATIEQNTAQLADQFDNVTAGGNAMATEAMA